MKPIILASGSPRRKELVKLLPWESEVYVKNVDEKIDKQLSPEQNVEALAQIKAMEVAKEFKDRIVIGADTMVCLDGEMLGKPKDEKDARLMLKKLSGRTHKVISGVAIICADKNIRSCFHKVTYVTMQNMDESEIEDYINTKEPLDKAGSYAVQGIGARYIEDIKGDYYNVVGFPVHEVYEKLKHILCMK